MRKKIWTTAIVACGALGLAACDTASSSPSMSSSSSTHSMNGGMAKAPPGGDYKKVSTLVPLPDFLPGLGTLYVQPSTLPAGPFLAYDKSGNLVSTIYMIPIKDIDAHKKFDDLAAASQKVDHVDMYYNAGHPGMAEPHYHVILWHVSPQQAAQLK